MRIATDLCRGNEYEQLMSAMSPKLKEAVAGEVYKSSRSDELYQALYVDDQIVVLRSDTPGANGRGANRLERRSAFEDQLESEFFEHMPDSELDMLSDAEMDWDQVDNIGAKTTENMHEAGFRTTVDVRQASDDELLDVSGLGQKGLGNLRQFAQ